MDLRQAGGKRRHSKWSAKFAVALAALVLLAALPFAALPAAALVPAGTFENPTSWDLSTQGKLAVTTDTSYRVWMSAPGVIAGGVGANETAIFIDGGVTTTLYLQDVNIDVSANPDARAFSMQTGATVTVNLLGTSTNTLVSGANHVGMEVIASTLIINGPGALAVSGSIYGMGSDVTINGGTITANGGIVGNSANHITINGGNITATGIGGAGIGGAGPSEDGNVNINGGLITATGGEDAAGIGGGNGGAGIVNINSATTTATAGTGSGAGIGGGANSDGIVEVHAPITAIGGTPTTPGNGGGAAVGGGGGTFGNNGGNGTLLLDYTGFSYFKGGDGGPDAPGIGAGGGGAVRGGGGGGGVSGGQGTNAGNSLVSDAGSYGASSYAGLPGASTNGTTPAGPGTLYSGTYGGGYTLGMEGTNGTLNQSTAIEPPTGAITGISINGYPGTVNGSNITVNVPAAEIPYAYIPTYEVTSTVEVYMGSTLQHSGATALDTTSLVATGTQTYILDIAVCGVQDNGRYYLTVNLVRPAAVQNGTMAVQAGAGATAAMNAAVTKLLSATPVSSGSTVALSWADQNDAVDFAISVYDPSGGLVSRATTTSTQYSLYGLVAGQYEVRIAGRNFLGAMGTETSVGTLSVTGSGATTTTAVANGSPQTGDTANLPLWFALGGLALAGLAAASGVVLRRRKQSTAAQK